jgi:membrane-bound lytic murein transglycosylase A
VNYADLPGWQDDQLADLLPGLRAECRRLALLPADTDLGGQGIAAESAGRAGQWQAACAASLAVTPGDAAGARQLFQIWFAPYRVRGTGLITGYYEPEMPGAVTRGGIFQIPLYGHPDDLVQDPAASPGVRPSIGRMVDGALVPYWSRAEIEAGRLEGHAIPIAWVADPVGLFFLQIQGAGRLNLPNGAVLRVGFGGSNGLPYTPIGRVLEQRGALDPRAVSLQAIRAWLLTHPDQAAGVMDANANYVFFRVLPEDGTVPGPPGALGVDLVPGRAAAVDRHYLPLGTPIFVDTTVPPGTSVWRHTALAQDIGTDIQGPARVDLFFGAGTPAEDWAGHMRQPGTVYVLLPRPPP